MGGGRKTTHTHANSHQAENVHPPTLERHSRRKNWKTKEKARTRRQKKIQGHWELVANTGDRSSLMTRRGMHHCLPLLHPQRYRQFSLTVWLRDPRLLLILLLPTIVRLNQAPILLIRTCCHRLDFVLHSFLNCTLIDILRYSVVVWTAFSAYHEMVVN